MAFRKKAELILSRKPDILIIQECEHIEKLNFKEEIIQPNDSLWFGQNLNKGLGVFSFGNYQLKLLEIHNPEIKTILPIQVTGGDYDFILFAIWAFNSDDVNYKYIGQVWKAIQYYEELLKSKKVILIGDFNSNVIWDKPRRKSNHSDVIKKLSDLNIFSTYHHHLNQIPGEEIHPTFYLYRHRDKPYHIDYCFASQILIDLIENVEIGIYDDWNKYSDHKPLEITFLK